MICAALFAAAGFLCAAAEEAPEAPDALSFIKERFGFELLQAGSWEYDGIMANRLKIALSAPFGLSFRSELLDRRAAPPKDGWTSGVSVFAVALYQRETNSRVLYGQLQTWGLDARTRNVWAHATPYFETHRASGADVRTEALASGKDSWYVAVGSPLAPLFDGNAAFPVGLKAKVDAAIAIDAERNALYQVGSDFHFGNGKKSDAKLRFEGMFSGKTVPERKQSTWFSDKPYLPPRRMDFYALNVTFSSPYVSFSSDFAHSEVFAMGEGVYVNGAVRIGDAPWRVSFACDGAGTGYSASDGSIPGSGLRAGGKFEWFGKRNMLILASTSLRAAAVGKPFDRFSTKLAYRFPIMKGFFITPSRVSFEFERDAQNPAQVEDRYVAFAGMNAGPLRPAVRFTYNEYVKTDVEISAPVYVVTLKGAFSYKTQPEKDDVFTLSLGASMQGKLGRLSVRIAKKEKEEGLDYYLSWRIGKKW
jgi:hypothetical protein